uniref:X-ray repair cross complementing 1 n=1 Tax=Sphenodon punctatus TaxID=8508 RepID=A0A8D0LAH8_SPHPU
MSPSESKSGTNLNRVRMFGPDKLVKAAAEKKWDRVKIICSQPYNKTLAYGLSFVKFHSPPENDETPSKTASPKVTKLGQFKVKDDDSNSISMRPGALFFSRASKPSATSPKASQSEQTSPSYADAMLQASTSGSPDSFPTATEKPITKPSSKEPTPGKRKFEFSKENTSPPSAAKKPDLETPRPTQPAPKKHKASSPAASPAPPAQKPQPTKKRPQAPSPDGEGDGALHSLLQGTVFVLSGFQNPFRSELRDKALEMGAKYRPDWTSDSTHLICAFANTPKYSHVKGRGGTIVRKEWVLDCYRTRRRLPCKRYLMDGPGSSSSEEEEASDEETPVRHRKGPTHRQKAEPPSSNHKLKAPVSPKAARPAPQKEESSEEEPSTSRGSAGVHNNSRVGGDESAASTDKEDPAGARDNGEEDSGDTDDELRRVEEEHCKKQVGREVPPDPDNDPYAGSTDENTDVEEKGEPDQPIPELPDFFVGKHFFLYGEFPSQERRLLNRFIMAFNGEVEEYMNERVNYVVTAQEWDDTFEEALNENANLSFVRPRWIYNCNERQKLIPHQPYVVVPRA